MVKCKATSKTPPSKPSPSSVLHPLGNANADFPPGFKNSADSDTNRPSCIRLEGGRAESETRYEILVNSVVNRPNSKVSAEIPS